MNLFLSKLPRNLLDCFRGWRLLWHALAIGLTFLLVASGFDWRYFLATRAPHLRACMFPAVPIGALLPIALPLLLLAVGRLIGSARTRLTGWAVGYADWPTNSYFVSSPTYAGHLGDYNGAYADSGYVYLTWMDNRLNSAGTLYVTNQRDIRFVKISWP